MTTIEDTLSRLIKNVNTSPFLFIGTGLSRRYLGADEWEVLLRRFAQETRKTDFAYEQYRDAARYEVTDEKTRLLPRIASLIEKDFNQLWYSGEQYNEHRALYEDCIKEGISPFKIEVGHLFKELSLTTIEDSDMKAEMELLKKTGEKSISGIITTNYDTMLESIFDEYTPYIGQSQLIFSPIQGVGEIYKIHGCCSCPESIVITEDDYKDFNDNNAYLSAKLLTVFLEHPIIFMGYSLNDENIKRILNDITKCLSQSQLSELKNRLIFIEWNNTDQPDEIGPYNIIFDKKSIEMTRIFIKDFSQIYQILLENEVKSRYSISLLRKLKKDIYDLVLANDPTSNIKVVSPYSKRYDDATEPFEFVIGVGVSREFGKRGLIGLTAEDLFRDIVFDDLKGYPDFDIKILLLQALPELLKRNSYSVPIYKYINLGYQIGLTLDQLPPEIHRTYVSEFSEFLCTTLQKEKLRRPLPAEMTINKLREECSDLDCIRPISLLDEDNIDLAELHSFLTEIFKTYPNILKKDSDGPKTDFRRLIKIFDWLKYH